MDRHNLKSLSLTHILGRSYKLWLKKKDEKKKPRVPSACCGFHFSCLPQPSAHVQLDLWNCGEPCCWCLQLEDKLRVRPHRHGQIAGGEQSRAEPAELSSSMECGFESNWELYPVCASHVFFTPCGDMMAVFPSTFLCSRTQCILKCSLLGDVFRNT